MRNRRNVLGLAAAAGLGSVLMAGRNAFGETARTYTVTIDGVSYTIPLMLFDKALTPSNPFVYQYEFMHVRIVDRELFINGRSRYKAKPGDKITIAYLPHIITVNGKPLPE